MTDQTDATGERPRLRDDLAELSGYHSPQVDVDVRLNTNESPFPPPVAFVAALSDKVREIALNRYPDRQVSDLRRAIADFVGVDVANVFAASGSNEVIQVLLLAYGGPGRSAVVFDPTYRMHTHIAEITTTQVVSVRRGNGFVTTPELVDETLAAHDPDIVFFCNPNNPTGTPEPRAVVETAAERPDRLVIVDEAYAEFAQVSHLDLAVSMPNVVVCRTMSKAWSLPALRVGYMVACPEIIADLATAHLPYHLDALAQAAGCLALDDFCAEMTERVALIVAERKRVSGRLESMPGIQIWPSAANFILFRTELDGDEVWSRLVDAGVLVRNAAGWEGTTGCLRVTVGTHEENDRFLDALATIVK